MIDPIAFFGIDIQKTTLIELKKKYYELALIVHPDKSRGESTDMCMLHSAYMYCKEMLQNAHENQSTYEERETDFEEFCKSQTKEPPSFADIYNDVFEMDRFNKEFDQTCVVSASLPEGYGNEMISSEYQDSNIKVPEYKPVIITDKYLKEFSKSVVEYREPKSYMSTFSGNLIEFKPVDSFTGYENNKLSMTDYKEANSAPQTLIDNRSKMTYESLIANREAFDKTLEYGDRPVLNF